ALEETKGVHGVNVLADEGRIAQLAIRRRPRPLRRHPARDVVVDLLGDVGLELARTLLVPVTTAEESRETHRLLAAKRDGRIDPRGPLRRTDCRGQRHGSATGGAPRR